MHQVAIMWIVDMWYMIMSIFRRDTKDAWILFLVHRFFLLQEDLRCDLTPEIPGRVPNWAILSCFHVLWILSCCFQIVVGHVTATTINEDADFTTSEGHYEPSSNDVMTRFIHPLYYVPVSFNCSLVYCYSLLLCSLCQFLQDDI